MIEEEPFLRIAVISDLHCQKGETYPKVSRLHTQLLDMPIKENPVESFKAIINEHNKHVDYLLILGDVTDKGEKDGLILGIKHIKELYNELNADKLIFTVGNHDLQKDNEEPSIMLKKTIGYPFTSKKKLSETFAKEFWADNNCIIEDEKSILLIINSSCNIKKTNEKALLISETLLDQIREKLKECNKNDKVKIALCHHHPITHSDINDTYSALDCIDRGDILIDLLIQEGFNILIHGHKHFPRLRLENALPIFCSGSFSSLENTVHFNENNTAHFIDFYKSDDNKFIGLIETWIFSFAKGWFKSTNYDERFPIYAGFGLEIDTDKLVSDIFDKFYKELINQKSKLAFVPIPFETIRGYFPEIKFLSPTQHDAFKSTLKNKYGISIAQDTDSNTSLLTKLYDKL